MEVSEESLYQLYDDMETDELHELYRNRKNTLTDTALGVLERVLSGKGVIIEEREELDEQMRNSSHDSNDASKKIFGHIPVIGGLLLAAIVGMVKHADNIFRPLLKGGDDAASIFVRHSDELPRYSDNGIDWFADTTIIHIS